MTMSWEVASRFKPGFELRGAPAWQRRRATPGWAMTASARMAPVSLRSNAPMNPELPALPHLAPGRYRHYKGGEYEVLAVARHSETLEVVVVYRPLYNDSGWWVRPYEMFTGSLEVGGVMRPRFERVGQG